jgi:hypothetical protein
VLALLEIKRANLEFCTGFSESDVGCERTGDRGVIQGYLHGVFVPLILDACVRNWQTNQERSLPQFWGRARFRLPKTRTIVGMSGFLISTPKGLTRTARFENVPSKCFTPP